MPSGVYDRSTTKKYHCRRCSLTFKSMSLIRKHQWAHPETYSNLRRKATDRTTSATTEISVRDFIDIPTAAGVLHTNGNGDMSVSQLLVILRRRKSFMADVIDLIGGIQAHPQEAAHE